MPRNKELRPPLFQGHFEVGAPSTAAATTRLNRFLDLAATKPLPMIPT